MNYQIENNTSSHARFFIFFISIIIINVVMNLIIILIVNTWPIRIPFKIYFRFAVSSIVKKK